MALDGAAWWLRGALQAVASILGRVVLGRRPGVSIRIPIRAGRWGRAKRIK